MRRTVSIGHILAAFALMSVLASCEHRILTDPKDNHYIRVYLDEEIRNVTCGIYNEAYDRPEYRPPINLRAALADPQTGEVLMEYILRGNGQDEGGRYIDGYIAAPVGRYSLVIHEVGLPSTKIRNMYDYSSMHAYTDPADGVAMREPDHMFYDMCDVVNVRYSQHVDTLYNDKGEHFRAGSIALSYFLQLKIKGISWATSASARMSGMAGSSMMNRHGGMVETDPVQVFFQMKAADVMRNTGPEASTAVLYATFNTFGKIYGQNTTLSLDFLKTDGSYQTEEIDITDMFDTPTVKEKQWILIEREIEITKPDGTGGMRPGVDGWKDEISDVPM